MDVGLFELLAARGPRRGRVRDRRGDQVPKWLAAPVTLLGGWSAGSSVAWAWEWFAAKQVGFEFGSEFEGYDWVLGFASVGVLVEAVLGSALAAKWAARGHRRRHDR